MDQKSPTHRRRRARSAPPEAAPILAPVTGHLEPLGSEAPNRIHEASLEILQKIGLSDAPEQAITIACAHGAKLTDDGRLVFPPNLVQTALEELACGFTLFAREKRHDIAMTRARVHTGSGGASPLILDRTGVFRNATIADLYDAARLVDVLDHVHFFARCVVPSDFVSARHLDINTAYAALNGTTKHVITSVSTAAHLGDLARMCHRVAGSEVAFRKRPFLSLNINHVVPPLRFDPEACAVLINAAKLGFPVMVNTFGQMGASSPVTLAGCLAQTNAETLAGMVLAWLANPNVRAVYGARPMITDLRSGAMAGGSGEQALLTAAATQMAQYYNLPNSTIAGATDSKTADAQSGYEKALSVSLAVQAGANLITQAAGTQAGLMATSFEAYVIDNDMLGAVLSAGKEIEVSKGTLDIEMITQTVKNEGHFLGHPETYGRMRSDFVYPRVANRQSIEAWQEDGAPSITDAARAFVDETLATHFPAAIAPEIDEQLRAEFDIALPQERMRTR